MGGYKMKRKIIFLICLTFIFSVFCAQFGAALPEDNTVQPRFAFIQTATVSLSINSNGTANYSASMTTVPGTTSSTKITMVLQRRKAGTSNSWVGVKTTSATGSSYCSLSSFAAGTKGYEYRVKATFTANGSYSESTIKYSSVKTYS